MGVSIVGGGGFDWGGVLLITKGLIDYGFLLLLLRGGSLVRVDLLLKVFIFFPLFSVKVNLFLPRLEETFTSLKLFPLIMTSSCEL